MALINELPDDLLVSIFSLLPMKDAARTSILSQRWKILWKYTAILEFDERDQMAKDISRIYESSMIHINQNWDYVEYFPMVNYANLSTAVTIVRRRFIDWVNQVIRSHHGSTINTFRISFYLNEESGKSDIDDWINFAIEKRVQKLELDLSPAKTMPSLRTLPYDQKRYILTSQLLHLHPLDSIRILRLNHVDVSEEVVKHILSNCQFLERLCIKESNSLVKLRVCGTSLRLKHLEISFCYRIECIEISAPNLVSFKCAGPMIDLLLKNAPCLVDASFGDHCAFCIAHNGCLFSSCLYQLEMLAMDFNLVLLERFRKFPELELNKLKQLKLSISEHHAEAIQFFCIFSLKKVPLLQKFALEVRDRNEARKVPPRIFSQNGARSSHQSLEIFEFVGFVRDAFDEEIVLHLSNYTVALKKIVIHPYKAQSEEITAARRNCARELKTKVRSDVELMVL